MRLWGALTYIKAGRHLIWINGTMTQTAIPFPEISTRAQVLALADRAGRHAASVYRALAAELAGCGRDDLAALYGDLAAQELSRLAALEIEPAETPGGQALSEHQLSAFAHGLTEDPSAVDLVRCSLYEALAEAVRDRDRAFAAYSYLAAAAPTQALRLTAEALAHGELRQAQSLRRKRRLAYRQRSRHRSTWPAVASLETADQCRAAAARGEARLAAALARHAARDSTLAALQREIAARLDLPANRPVAGEPAASLLGQAEEAFLFYDALTSQATEDSTLRFAQGLATLALDRLKRIRDLNGGR